MIYSKLNQNNHNTIEHHLMRVTKRDNRGTEEVKFDKITTRIKLLCMDLHQDVNPVKIAMQTISGLYDGIATEQLDEISAKIAESYKTLHPDYSKLSSRLLISNLHKCTPKKFSECMTILAENKNIISPQHYEFIVKNATALDNMIVDANDYLFEYIGYKTLEMLYLNKLDDDERVVYLDDNGDEVRQNIVFVDDKPMIKYTSAIIAINGKYMNKYGEYICPDDVINSNGRFVKKNEIEYKPLFVKKMSRVMDRPQYMFMRVAIAIAMGSSPDPVEVLQNIKTNYDLFSQLYLTHATPTLFNACSPRQQLNSCFLLGTNDSIEGIMNNLTNASLISKSAGGVGLHMSNIRSVGSKIKSTRGISSGLPQQLKLFNAAACTWDQGGRRKGAFAIYIEPWHGDIMNFLRLKLNQGDDSLRAKDLFYALWVPDLFVHCAKHRLEWSLFSEDTAPGLSDVYDGMMVCTKCKYCVNKAYSKYVEGSNVEIDGLATQPVDTQVQCQHKYAPMNVFSNLYKKYTMEGRACKIVKAEDIMDAICELQRESGTPYICMKDMVNRMSNQEGVGTIKSSNLCTEIMEWSSDTSYACCTLASINLKQFLIMVENRWVIDHEKLHSVTETITKNLDLIIDANDYPLNECKDNSYNYRPIGIGVQGLANVFMQMRIPFISEEAQRIDLEIFETIYHASLVASCARAQTHGRFMGFEHSPAARGELAPDLWQKNQALIDSPLKSTKLFSGRYDFNQIRQQIIQHGLRNSLHVALMPTVSTSQVLGNNESFEPIPANIYVKTTLGGKFVLSNSQMITHLMELGLWNEETKISILNNEGSLQHIQKIPENIRAIYSTIYEIKQTDLMNRCSIRQAFVDQSQSLNIYVKNNTNATLRGIFFYGAKIGLKTTCYYIRTKQASAAMKNNTVVATEVVEEIISCNPGGECVACSS